MIELSVKIVKKSFEIPSCVGDGFEVPLVTYFLNKEDDHTILYTFVIADFLNKELTYLHTYTKENIELLKAHSETKIMSMKIDVSNPHCVLGVDPEENCYMFMEGGANFFLHIDRKRSKMRICFAKDFPALSGYEIENFGETFYKDDEDKNYFYFSARGNRRGGSENEVFFFRASLDLCNIENIFQTASFDLPVAHMTRKFGKHLLNSEFDSREYEFDSTGERFKAEYDLKKYVYKELFREFCSESSMVYSEEAFEKNCEIRNNWNFILSPTFKSFCDNKGNNWREICRHDKKYSFSALPGNFTVINLAENKLRRYATTFCRPGHFEVDEVENVVYTSSHNFIRFDKLFYIGPAAIDKFLIKDSGEAEKVGSFVHPTGYRFTTHRLFSYDNKQYFCTVGFPNRIFFVDAGTMELAYHDDLGGDLLTGVGNTAEFLNKTELRHLNFGAFEVSSNGGVVCLVNKGNLYFYSFRERRLIYRIALFVENAFDRDIVLFPEGFRNRTTHVGCWN